LSRPHEDRERHTLVDHRPGGTPVTFPKGTWVVVGVARVKAERNDALVSAYETLVEKARSSNVHAGSAAVLSSQNGRRVVTMVAVRGHEGFRELAAAWDDHHRNEQHRAIGEPVSLGLYEVVDAIAAADIDPASHDAFVYEHFDRLVPKVAALFASTGNLETFRGATILNRDDGAATVVLTRFANAAAYEGFRASRDATNALGSTDQSGTTSFPVHAVRTFTTETLST
jgi:hypothetical protein